MTTSLQLRIQLPDVTGEGATWRFAPVLMALECLTRINQWHFRRGVVPPLFDSGIRYIAEPPGEENWNDAPTVATMKRGDCEDLAAYCCAEIREQGIASLNIPRGDAECIIKQKFITAEAVKRSGYPIVPKQGIYLVHCMVRAPDGRVIDPSKMLGMAGEYQ